MFSKFRPAVEHVLETFEIRQTTQFRQFVRDELSEISPDVQHQFPDKKKLNTLYELRARFLDWELGTGYLGFFSENPGTRYTFTRRLEAVFHMLPAPLRPGEKLRVLEIGCGAGMLCLELARRTEWVVGIDISYFVLDFANKVKDYIECKNVFFQHGDAENLTFKDETFDLVICSEVLEHLLAPQDALAEIRRVLKKNGVLILTTPCALSLSDMFMSIFRIFNKHVESEKDVHFDKKTFIAVRRSGKEKLSEFSKIQGVSNNGIFMRVHKRFQYHDLTAIFQNAGFEIEQTVGTVFAFPPHYQVFYRYCPGFVLPAVRLLEHLLNRLRIFQQFGSVTTCFKLKPIRKVIG